MGEVLETPVEEASVWHRADFAGRSDWIDRLDEAELQELSDALAYAKKRGTAARQFGRDGFPLPRMGARIARLLAELEHGRGFVLLRGLGALELSPEDLATVYWGLGCHLGTAISQNPRGDLLVPVTDRGDDYTKVNQRGHTTNAELLPHCDTSDVVGLLCVHPAKQGGASSISSATAIYNAILAEHPEYLPPLCRGFRISLAGKGPSGRADEVTNNTIPVFSWHAGRMSCRFNRKQIEDGALDLGTPLTELEAAAVAHVADLAMDERFRLDMDFQPGDIQLLNNHMILHSRTAFVDHEDPARRRLLWRLWLNVPNGRPLAPEFADRLNTGPRGGVAVTARAA